MKKILYIWKDVYPWDIRVQKVCESLAKNGYEVFLLCRWKKGQKKSEIINGINVIRVGFGRPSFMTIPLQFNPIWDNAIEFNIRKIKPNLIIIREILLAISAGRFAKKYGIPVIMDMAENYPAAMRDFKKYNQSKFLKYAVHKLKLPDKIEKTSVALMDGIFVVCDEQIQRLSDNYNFDKKRISVVHNTITRGVLKPVKTTKDDKIITILHHGWMSGEKSLTNLIKAFKITIKSNQNLKLVLAGNGECEDEYKQLAIEEIKSGKIVFLGKYNYDELQVIINQCDYGIIPYQVSDFNNYTIHNKIFDYFAVGKPVIVSEVAPLKRIMLETNAGIIANCENVESLSQTLSELSKNNYDLLSSNAYKSFENKYNWEEDGRVLLNFIHKFID